MAHNPPGRCSQPVVTVTRPSSVEDKMAAIAKPAALTYNKHKQHCILKHIQMLHMNTKRKTQLESKSI